MVDSVIFQILGGYYLMIWVLFRKKYAGSIDKVLSIVYHCISKTTKEKPIWTITSPFAVVLTASM